MKRGFYGNDNVNAQCFYSYIRELYNVSSLETGNSYVMEKEHCSCKATLD